jgi:hypothetical protein
MSACRDLRKVDETFFEPMTELMGWELTEFTC